MRSEPKNQISRDGVKVWRITACITSFVLMLAAAGLIAAGVIFKWPVWIGILSAAVWLGISFVIIIMIPNIRHRVWRYEVHENEIDIQHGIFVVTRVIVPMVRVQHVDTSQGPILRKYNLASVQISTAATTHSIPALDVEEADQLRDSISRLARVTEDDV
ncbi:MULTISPECIES: PH domain-containing protein [Bacillus]|uniref:Conserved membrane protein YdbS n=1 Tax=Bacillus licheniformis (strain ATCC 14580 / DSM 13 / JCM 2505 / CCUG 7422 / NBRC 12200 / NCIMB 9375 / NCTC 10341 / NRRL NRS-1264 / Gibson 46) TaxID=279010 RepID=Q65N61_BACLD|nr:MULTISPECIES: PH domain-containing protein [Bacillus]AAU22148.1 conserved membrane protein YdbS [Bacillus licheniformis DSM 13 = ATCC 14580]AAU39503.1 cytosolic protein YdbS [Bacillus licheniformis DSM 13 = ATCC 14580]EFV69936.1 YdbS protein [Bacillus sp. BT1B_CT2]MBA1159990.1 PH domain-containing protein [Bacillus licheniformis]MBG9697177.1 membrane protein [Bacillus licheniformis]